MRPREVAIVAARELRESTRSRWFLCLAAAFLCLSLALSALGLAGADRSGLAGYDRTTASLLNLALMFVPLLTLTLGGLGIAGEIEDGSLASLLAHPVTRAEVYAGKYLGLLGAVGASLGLGLGAAGVAIGLRSEGGSATSFLALAGILFLLAAATLAVGVMLSAMLRGRAKVLGASFLAWLLFVYVGDLGTIALTIARNLRPAQVFLLALLNPVQEARLLGTLALTDRLEMLGPAGIYGMDRFGAVGLPLLLAAGLVATTVLALGLGLTSFRRAPLS